MRSTCLFQGEVYDIASGKGTSITINYYADMFGFVTAKTIEYTYETNINGTPYIIGVYTNMTVDMRWQEERYKIKATPHKNCAVLP